MAPSYEAKEYYQDEAVAAGYDRARFRGVRGALVNRLEQRLLMSLMAGVAAGARVLDLPVGTGRLARRLQAAGYRVTGADLSLPMLRQARGMDGGDGLVRGDAEALPFADKSFEVALCFRLLSHLPEAARTSVLREMGRVASDRVIAVYQPHKLAAWWFLNGLLLRRPVPRYYVSAQALTAEFASCGLTVVDSRPLLRGAFMERAYVLKLAAGA